MAEGHREIADAGQGLMGGQLVRYPTEPGARSQNLWVPGLVGGWIVTPDLIAARKAVGLSCRRTRPSRWSPSGRPKTSLGVNLIKRFWR